MSFLVAIWKIIIIFLSLFHSINAFVSKVTCNSTTPDGYSGTCEGDYCFNIEDQFRGCVNFYKMVRDDNIACGHMHLFGASRKACICSQPYCSKYAVGNMPMQTLANVSCTCDKSPGGFCSPGPCYVGNDILSYDNKSTTTSMLRTCMRDWFAVTSFKEIIIYEVPPLANHSACFFDQDKFNCMCKDPGCNEENKPAKEAVEADQYFQCHKMHCRPDQEKNCNEKYLGTDMCHGQMCYYLKTQYDFTLEGKTYKESNIIRDCLNYSFENPIEDLNFLTRFEFGEKSTSDFFPCRGDLCNNVKTAGSSTIQASLLFLITSLLFLAYRY